MVTIVEKCSVEDGITYDSKSPFAVSIPSDPKHILVRTNESELSCATSITSCYADLANSRARSRCMFTLIAIVIATVIASSANIERFQGGPGSPKRIINWPYACPH